VKGKTIESAIGWIYKFSGIDFLYTKKGKKQHSEPLKSG